MHRTKSYQKHLAGFVMCLAFVVSASALNIRKVVKQDTYGYRYRSDLEKHAEYASDPKAYQAYGLKLLAAKRLYIVSKGIRVYVMATAYLGEYSKIRKPGHTKECWVYSATLKGK